MRRAFTGHRSSGDPRAEQIHQPVPHDEDARAARLRLPALPLLLRLLFPLAITLSVAFPSLGGENPGLTLNYSRRSFRSGTSPWKTLPAK